MTIQQRAEVQAGFQKFAIFLVTEPYPDGYAITEKLSILVPTLKQHEVFIITQRCKAFLAKLQACKANTRPDFQARVELVKTLFKQTASHN